MANSDKSLASLIADLSRETSTLVRDEVQLAKAEMSQKVDQVTNHIISIISGRLFGRWPACWPCSTPLSW